MMRLAVAPLLLAPVALAPAVSAQTPAKANVRVGCTVPGPPDSLIPAPVNPTIRRKMPINMEDARIWPELMEVAMAYAPITFMGWTGTVMPK